jgi:hypothetical protein
MTKKLAFAFICLLVFSFAVTAFTNDEKKKSSKTLSNIEAPVIATEIISPETELTSTVDLYETLNLQSLKLTRQAFDFALKGYNKLKASGKVKSNLLTIVDFSQPSTNKRMYVIDVNAGKLVLQSVVAHGRNSGALMANSFSNEAESYKSSLGFYVTSETYQGKHGLSLRLDGLESNINDNARARAVVVHGADYAEEGFYKSTGYLGRSFGCPAVPTKDAKKIINTIKNGSCLFLYSPDKKYVGQSKMIA